jgi:predicted transcriptional regulator
MGQLEPPDLWVVQVLRAAGGWVAAEKIAAVLCAVKLHYPVPGVRFELSSGAVRSPEVEEALRRLAEQGLVEESEGAYRLTRRGNKLAEKALPRSGWTLPYADVVFYLAWDVGRLAERVRPRTS